MDKAEQPTTQADRRLDELKPRDIDGHLSDAIQDCLRQRFGLVLSTSETTIMAQGAIAALNTRTASPAAQDGLVEALEGAEVILSQYANYLDGISYRELDMHPYIPSVQQTRDDVRKALSAIKEQHHD
jgi:hypothetical protein